MNNEKIKDRTKVIERIDKLFFQEIMAPSWKDDINLWFQKYSFDDEVMIALFQYCYEQCALHRKYIEIVAEEWSKKNIQTYEDLQRYCGKSF